MGTGIVQFDFTDFEVILFVPCPSLTGKYPKIYSVRPGFCWGRAVTFLYPTASEYKLCAVRPQAFLFSRSLILEPPPAAAVPTSAAACPPLLPPGCHTGFCKGDRSVAGPGPEGSGHRRFRPRGPGARHPPCPWVRLPPTQKLHGAHVT